MDNVKITKFEQIHFQVEENICKEIYKKKFDGLELDKVENKYLIIRKNCFLALITSVTCIPFSLLFAFRFSKLSKDRFTNLNLVKKNLILLVGFSLLGFNSMGYNLYYSIFNNPIEFQILEKKYRTLASK